MDFPLCFGDIKQDLRRLSDRMESKFDAVDKKFESLEGKFDRRCDRLESRMWAHCIWLTTLIMGLAGLIAHAHHWI